ncbi:hypothetical protein L596_007141 [Steinernema carpocapsae]|uniref:Protein quiver n=1 Tax=Steinernema carpocapsae TaxID=34508 RepID=A0A4U5P8C9_STECR|nr:hypothetical protein L596_007141 [Steinernema carpocapsae]
MRVVALIVVIIPSLQSLACWHCGGGRLIAFDQWMLVEGEQCRLNRVICQSSAHSCLVAQIKGSQNFTITGCSHDRFFGCDSNRVPFDSVVYRCQCMGDYCNAIWFDLPPVHPRSPLEMGEVVKSSNITFLSSVFILFLEVIKW